MSINAAGFPVADVKLTSQRLAVAGTTLEGVALDLAVEDYLGRPFPVGAVRGARVEAGAGHRHGPRARPSRDGDFTRLEATAKANGAPVTLAGQASLAPTETVIGIDALTADIPNAAVALTAPATITIKNGTTEIGKLELKAGDGSLSLVGRTGSTLDLDATLDRVPAALANPFVEGLDAAGVFTGSARVSGSPAAPEAVFDLRAEGLATSQTRGGEPARPRGAGRRHLCRRYPHPRDRRPRRRRRLADGERHASARRCSTCSSRWTRLPVALANDFVSGLGASGTISGTGTATGTLADAERRLHPDRHRHHRARGRRRRHRADRTRRRRPLCRTAR